jgi:DNA-binding transcriptional LysR family regulator
LKSGRKEQIPAVDFDLRQLEIFKKVVELGSFSKASRAVFLAQASVSERIATLESMVGARLLDRLGRKIVPTKAGELLYKHAVLLLGMKDTARMEMQRLLGLKAGSIRMGGSTIPGEYILPRVLGGFSRLHPYLMVTLEIADTGRIEQRVAEGELEIGVLGSPSKIKQLAVRELWKDELVVVVPKGHPLSEAKEIDIRDLIKEPFIVREEGSGTFRIIEDYLKKDGLRGVEDLKTCAVLGSSTAVKEGIKGGLGISILSIRAVETEQKAGILSTLRIRGRPMFRSFYLVRDRRRIASPPCAALWDYLLSTEGDNLVRFLDKCVEVIHPADGACA